MSFFIFIFSQKLTFPQLNVETSFYKGILNFKFEYLVKGVAFWPMGTILSAGDWGHYFGSRNEC